MLPNLDSMVGISATWHSSHRLTGAGVMPGCARAPSANLVPAWRNVAEVLERAGKSAEASEARRRAQAAACRAPRGFPHGVGLGDITEYGVGRRQMLLLDADGLGLAGPETYRSPCGWFGHPPGDV